MQEAGIRCREFAVIKWIQTHFWSIASTEFPGWIQEATLPGRWTGEPAAELEPGRSGGVPQHDFVHPPCLRRGLGRRSWPGRGALPMWPGPGGILQPGPAIWRLISADHSTSPPGISPAPNTPQTLPGHGMNGAPLAGVNGAPVRLATPDQSLGYKPANGFTRLQVDATRKRASGTGSQGYEWFAGL